MSTMRVLAAMLACGLALALTPSLASAGQWVQVSCVNPDGSAASNQGWSESQSSNPAPEPLSNADTNCGPGSPMQAHLSSSAPATVGAYEGLTYSPPAGSTLAGGTIDVGGYGGGYGSGSSASSMIYTPALVYPSDVFYQCVDSDGACQNGTESFHQQFTLPTNAGGGIYLQANCASGYNTGQCTAGADSAGEWVSIQLYWGDLLLTSSGSPAGSNFTGTVLGPSTGGSASLNFTASEAQGPGIYRITATLDGSQVYSATPDTNSGQCVSHGSYAGTGALEFDFAQPCPLTENVSIPINTATVANGNHELKVTAADAAGNSSVVFDQNVNVQNPVTTQTTPQSTTVPSPAPAVSGKKQIRVRIGLSWTWRRNNTRLHAIRFADRIPAHSTVSITCKGRHCPHNLGRTSNKLHLKTLIKRLKRDVFHPGQRLYITIAHPGYIAQRAEVMFRKGVKPRTKLL